MNNHLNTALQLEEIARAVVTLDMILPTLDLDKIAPHQRAGFLNSLDRVHDRIHQLKQTEAFSASPFHRISASI